MEQNKVFTTLHRHRLLLNTKHGASIDHSIIFVFTSKVSCEPTYLPMSIVILILLFGLKIFNLIIIQTSSKSLPTSCRLKSIYIICHTTWDSVVLPDDSGLMGSSHEDTRSRSLLKLGLVTENLVFLIPYLCDLHSDSGLHLKTYWWLLRWVRLKLKYDLVLERDSKFLFCK